MRKMLDVFKAMTYCTDIKSGNDATLKAPDGATESRMFIVYQLDSDTIYGTGDTLDAAWADAREWTDRDLRGLVAREASAELVDTVRATGGFGIVWYVDTDGTAELVADDHSRSYGPRR